MITIACSFMTRGRVSEVPFNYSNLRAKNKQN
jgi:hypothetical protein